MGEGPSSPHRAAHFNRSQHAAPPACLPSARAGGRVGLARQAYRLWGAAHGHLHVVALTGLAPQVVHHLHKAAPPAGLLVGLPGQPQPQGGAPQPASQGQPDARLGAVSRQHPRAHPQQEPGQRLGHGGPWPWGALGSLQSATVPVA